jgi:formylglycine-generating enzyme required for sulfatase activity
VVSESSTRMPRERRANSDDALKVKLSEWSRADRAERLAWVDQVASAVPDGFKPLAEVAGTRSLPVFEHRPTRTRWVYVPGGSFNMGLSEREERAARTIEDPPPLNLDEMRPCHSVDLRPFLMMELPVTWGLALGHLKVKDLEDRPEFEGPRDARPAYLRRAEVERVASALSVALPTEEQWEYACRGGTETLFFFGDSLPKRRAELSALVGTEIEKNAANPFGLKGLFVGEWCRDRFRPSYDAKRATKDFVIRGGASVFWPWQGSEWALCVSASRMPSRDLVGGWSGARFVVDL